jgi:hypothetical protein
MLVRAFSLCVLKEITGRKPDQNGVFQGVMQKDKRGNETMISIGNWNKKFKSDDNK